MKKHIVIALISGLLMSPGAKYELFIPGHLGYGQNEGPEPGGPMATIIFD